MAKTKADKENELKQQLQHEADAHIAAIKAASDRSIRRKAKKIKRLYIVMAVLAVFVIAGGVAGGLAYRNVKNENKRLSDPTQAAKAETERIKSQVAALIDVPGGEEPTIANVADAAKAKEQSPEFFAKAENNDKLLMYAKAKKAILYRPSTNKIVEVSTLNIGSGDQKSADTATPAADGSTTTPAGTTTQQP